MHKRFILFTALERPSKVDLPYLERSLLLEALSLYAQVVKALCAVGIGKGTAKYGPPSREKAILFVYSQLKCSFTSSGENFFNRRKCETRRKRETFMKLFCIFHGQFSNTRERKRKREGEAMLFNRPSSSLLVIVVECPSFFFPAASLFWEFGRFTFIARERGGRALTGASPDPSFLPPVRIRMHAPSERHGIYTSKLVKIQIPQHIFKKMVLTVDCTH